MRIHEDDLWNEDDEAIPLHRLTEKTIGARSQTMSAADFLSTLDRFESHFMPEQFRYERVRDDLELLASRVQKWLERYHDVKPPYEGRKR